MSVATAPAAPAASGPVRVSAAVLCLGALIAALAAAASLAGLVAGGSPVEVAEP